MTRHEANDLWKNFRDHYDLYIINPEKVQEQTCEKLKSDFDLSDDEAKNYYDMIKDDENNKIIKEVEKKVRVEVKSASTFKVEFNYGKQ